MFSNKIYILKGMILVISSRDDQGKKKNKLKKKTENKINLQVLSSNSNRKFSALTKKAANGIFKGSVRLHWI